MKVKIYEEKTTVGKRYGLKNANSGDVLYYHTAKWKTVAGVKRAAAKAGYEVVE